MAAGSKKRGRAPALQTQVAQTPPTEKAPATSKWVERPIEPVVANGCGMRILGFVPHGGLETTPLQKLAPAAKDAQATVESVSDGHGGGSSGSVQGPKLWKRGKPVYEHGNYGRYYGYRHGDGAPESGDLRLGALTARLGKEFLRQRDVLDIGCNAGLVSLAVAQHFGARRVVGMDIDASLIEAARSNLLGAALEKEQCQVDFRAEDILCSPLRRPPDDKPERFDVVLCLSVTKWVHFAHGDTGVHRLFKRCLKRLRPGGIFVLEPQEWSSYKKKRHLTPAIRETVAGIQIRPDDFDEYLVSLGFEKVDVIEPSGDAPRNFQRSLRIFRRPDTTAQEEEKQEEAKEESAQKKRRK
eukprot:TRINITY_DN14872_c0_g3_i1.p1 TRINITY_DN14872_c0_g3~~TRINITY_DN14872_c0_g3_i1.p1  ORF type:complete len:355 (+),score=72.93 TRINITY_DN14872_c0_g3_i1:38-1102(+)